MDAEIILSEATSLTGLSREILIRRIASRAIAGRQVCGRFWVVSRADVERLARERAEAVTLAKRA